MRANLLRPQAALRARPIAVAAFTALAATGIYRHLEAAPAGAATARTISSLRQGTPPAEPGTLPDSWVAGVDCENEPGFQIHPYNENLYIIRQNKCTIFEAPFLYLIFGADKALLMDTGAHPNAPVMPVVKAVIDNWLQVQGRDSIPLIVAHTHSHADHVAGDGQFEGQPFVETVVGLGQNQVEQYWGFQDFPNDKTTIDLGNRVIDVLGTPGHQSASVTLYDRNTHLLLTGDIVYPGHLFVFSKAEWPHFVASLARLVKWARTHPVEWVLGCHIEMSATPGVPYAWGTPVHPTEHPLEMHPKVLGEIYCRALSMGGNPECTIFDSFVIHPVYKCGITWNG